MKSYAPILGFLSLLWLGLGSWWLSNMTCGASDSTVFSVTDGKFMTQSDGIFSFNESSSKLENYSKTVKASFTNVAKHLKDNPNRMLALTGLYGNNEKNNTDFNDLGVARAESVKAKLVDLGVEIDRITTTGQKMANLSFIKKRMEGGVNFTFNSLDAAPTSDAGMSDESGTTAMAFSSSSPMNLNITSADFDVSGNTDFQNYIKGLGTYMTDNPDARILLASFNNDRKVRASIRRNMRSYLMDELGLESSRFSKLEGKAGDSPTGEAMISVGIK